MPTKSEKWGGIAAMTKSVLKAQDWNEGSEMWDYMFPKTEAELRRRVEPLLLAMQELLDVMETCHICKGTLILQEHPVYCEDCSSDCENHEEPECTPIYVLHAKNRKELDTWK